MSRVRHRAILACAVVGACLTTPAAAATHLVLGRSFTVKDSSAGADAARRRVVVKAKETASAAPVPDVGSGGELVIETDGASQTLPLPAAGWRISGTGVKYVDSQTVNGAVKTVVIRRSARGTFTMKAVLTGAHAPLDLVPPNPGTEGALAVVLYTGDFYCTHFGGVAGGLVRNDGARRFDVKNPTAVGPCPGNLGPTTTWPPTTPPTTATSTTVSTTTSTTGTTILGPPCGAVVGPAPFCWGECPPETPICADVAGTCRCVSGTQPCGGIREQTCDGACPAGEVCVSGGLDCACMPAGGTPCVADTGDQVCGGFCPPEETCLYVNVPTFYTGCFCVPPDCSRGGEPGCEPTLCPVESGRHCEVVPVGQLHICACMP
jgi:hypothetical protein